MIARRRYLNKYQKTRRATLRQKGICVDCQKNKVPPPESETARKHVCCESCRRARRERWSAAKLQPVLPFATAVKL